jgi:peroxiredoxin
MGELFCNEPLPHGQVAPDFWLRTAAGEIVTRHHYRNKAALILCLFAPSPSAWEYLSQLAQLEAEYRELNAQPIAILTVAAEFNSAQLATDTDALPPSILLLADLGGKTWAQYAGQTLTEREPMAAAVVVLDLYGGIEAQCVTTTISQLPPPSRLIEWARGAQYRCNI